MLSRMQASGADARRPLVVAVTVAIVLVAGACTGEEAEPVSPSSTLPGGGAHLLEPNDEMRRLAEEQCRDDPSLAQGEIRAVDPADPDQVLAVVTVDCEDVR